MSRKFYNVLQILTFNGRSPFTLQHGMVEYWKNIKLGLKPKKGLFIKNA